MRKLIFILAATAWGQQQLNLAKEAKNADFTNFPATSPVKTGTTLPATCVVGNLFFLSSAPAGQNLYACTSTNVFTLLSGGGGGGGTATIEANGTVVGSRSTQNFIPGLGVLDVLTDTGTQINIQQSADNAVVQTRATDQAGTNLLCASASGSATAYTCAMSSTLQVYTSGMLLRWIPDVTGTGAATLNIDTLGAKSIKLADGATDPTSADILTGSEYQVWYDGANFRLAIPPVIVGFAGTTQPACNASQRGRIWQTFGATGVKDSVTVCAKDAGDVFAWRTIF